MGEFDAAKVLFSIDILSPRPHQTFSDYEAVPVEVSASTDAAEAGAVILIAEIFALDGTRVVRAFERRFEPGRLVLFWGEADATMNQTLVITITITATAESVKMSVPFHKAATHLSYLKQCDWKSRDKKLPPKDWKPDYGHVECVLRSSGRVCVCACV